MNHTTRTNPNPTIYDDVPSEEGISDIEEEKGNENIKIEVPFNPEDINI